MSAGGEDIAAARGAHGGRITCLIEDFSKAMLRRVNELILETQRSPFEGIGKPEDLRFDWSGYWSRRINHEHRLVYKVTDREIIIVQCRLHY